MKQIFTRMFFGIAFPLLLCLVTGGVMAQPIQPILDSSDKFYSIGDFKKAMQIARIAGTIALRDSGFKSKIYAQILGLYYSMNLEGQGKLDSTEYYYLSGINIYRELGASNDTVYSTILINLANFYNARMQLPSKAASYFKEAEAIIKEKMSDGNIDKAAFYNNIGLYYYHTNQFKEADDQFNESLRLMELYHPSSIDTSIFTIVNLVELYKILGLYNRAYEKEYEYLRKVNYGDVGNKRAVLSALMQLNELAIYTHPEHPLTDSLNKIMEDLKLKKVDTIYVNACIIANKLRRYLFTDPKEVVRIYNEMGNLRQNPYYAGGTFAVIDIIPIMLDAYGQTGEINKAITLFEESVYQNKDWNNHNILRRWLYMQQGVCLYLMAGNKTKAKALLQELVTMSTNRII
jgi:tetratricopeptide (TPR) repeat protein